MIETRHETALLLRTIDKAAIGLSALAFLVFSLIAWLVLGPVMVVGSLTIMLALLLAAQAEAYRRLHQGYEQIESLFSLFSVLKIRRPLPKMGDWAISADFANLLVESIQEHRPRHILELGSGVSTLIMGYCIQSLGVGTVTSLEHDEKWAAATSELVRAHGLDSVAKIQHAPLVPVTLEGRRWRWYDTTTLPPGAAYDMLVVDGPPAVIGPLARYPALPLVITKLTDAAVVLVDDASRPDERETVRRWLVGFKEFTSTNVPTKKGAVVLRRGRQNSGNLP